MTRFILRGLFYGFCILALHSVFTQSIQGFNEYHRIISGQACVDTATARGWIIQDEPIVGRLYHTRWK